MYCKSYGELYDLEFTILRFGIPYGPRARPAAVIPSFVNRALDGEPLTIAGTGDQSRRFVYVEDLAEGVAGALCPKAANRIFNLVSNEDVTIRQIADTVREVIGDVEIVHGPGRAADFNGVEVCGKRAARELGWTASTPFDEGVRRYVAWHREERERVASVPAAPEPVSEPSRETLPVLKPAPVPERRRYPRLPLTRPLARAAAFSGLTLGIVGMLTAYLIAMHSVGLDNDEERTVGAVSVILLGLLLVPAFDWRRQFRRALATASWLAAAAYVIALLLPWSRDKLNLASPDAALLLLGVAGAGLGLALAIGGHRLVRSDSEERPLVRSDPEERPSKLDA
jgi:UDP-glucose 4-epimerase